MTDNAVDALVRQNIEQAGRETRNLAEMLSVDFLALLSKIDGIDERRKASLKATLTPKGIVGRMQDMGWFLSEVLTIKAQLRLREHPSDLVRGWAAYALVYSHPHASWRNILRQLRPLADDHHFGVREWAWLALRPRIVEAPEAALTALTPWLREESAFLRRFCSEATRPRGVWCRHIPLFRHQPWVAEDFISHLRDDNARYVQNSVGNWLNDASKDAPGWVTGVCNRWQQSSASPHTTRITKRALRTLHRNQEGSV